MKSQKALTITQKESALICVAGPELTIYQVKEVHQQLMELQPFAQDMVWDLTETKELDTAGLQLLLAIEAALNHVHLKFEITSRSREVDDVFRLFNCFNNRSLMTWDI